jgi:hypothetical protein
MLFFAPAAGWILDKWRELALGKPEKSR